MFDSNTMLLIVLSIALGINALSAIYIYHKGHKVGYREGVQNTLTDKVGEGLQIGMDEILVEIRRENAIKESRLMLETTKVKQEWVRLQIEEKKLQTLKDLEGEKKD